jgi:hypothetical protein
VTAAGTPSAASAAVVALQSYLKAVGRPLWTASQLNDLLKSTGTPQGGDTAQRIGPLPDLQAALTALG